jgi:hypothetical protein
MPQHLQATTAGIDPSGIFRYPGDVFDAPNGIDLSAWTVAVSGATPDDPPNDLNQPQTGIINPPTDGG